MPPKNAATIADAAGLSVNDVFDLDAAYVGAIMSKKRDNRQGEWHPSAIDMCGRMNVYDFIRTPKNDTPDPDAQDIFDMGHAIHALVQGRFTDMSAWMGAKKFGYQFEAEKRYDPAIDELYNTFGCGGTADGLLEIWTDTWRQRGILEIKSINDEGYKSLTKPKYGHVLQAHLYCFRFNCPVMWIWYFNKNNSRRKIYPVVFDQATFDVAIGRLETWHTHVMNKTLPPREESYFGCMGCAYRDTCKPQTLTNLRSRGVNTAKVNLR